MRAIFSNIEAAILEEMTKHTHVLCASGWLTSKAIIRRMQKMTARAVVGEDKWGTDYGTIDALVLTRGQNMMHHKFMVLGDEDGWKVVINGSYNFTENAKGNDENVTIIHSSDLASQYLSAFETMHPSEAFGPIRCAKFFCGGRTQHRLQSGKTIMNVVDVNAPMELRVGAFSAGQMNQMYTGSNLSATLAGIKKTKTGGLFSCVIFSANWSGSSYSFDFHSVKDLGNKQPHYEDYCDFSDAGGWEDGSRERLKVDFDWSVFCAEVAQ